MNSHHGWLIVNKPKGTSSNHAVQVIKRLLGKNNKVGHAGTLDPLAEGVLPIAIGEATKTTQYMMDKEKEYEFSIAWGQERSSYDAEGEIMLEDGRIPDKFSIEKILSKFIGEIYQAPPIYSAIKINGKPAYKLARAGKDIELSKRKVIIKNLELLGHDNKSGISSFTVTCGRGTYIRSLAVDIARSLGVYGYVSALKRMKVGNFLINDAIMLANLDKIVHNILPVTSGLGDILAIEVTESQAKALKNGIKIFLPDQAKISSPVVQILLGGVLQAIVCLEKGVCISARVFNL